MARYSRLIDLTMVTTLTHVDQADYIPDGNTVALGS